MSALTFSASFPASSPKVQQYNRPV